MIEIDKMHTVGVYHIPRDDVRIHQYDGRYYRRMNGSNHMMNDYEVDLNKEVRNKNY